MSGSEAGAAELELCGWGRVGGTRAGVVRPRDADQAGAALTNAARAGHGLIARGAGRSYGDAAQNGAGLVLDMNGLDRILSIDTENLTVTAQSGATLGSIMGALSDHCLTLPVVPGTRHVTLAGAIASDIHGKNHHYDGAFARHVEQITLLTPAGQVLELTAGSDAELFFATLGGMGLTGVILQARVRAEPLAQPWVAEDVGPHERARADTRADRRRGSPALLGRMAGHAGRGAEHGQGDRQPRRPAAGGCAASEASARPSRQLLRHARAPRRAGDSAGRPGGCAETGARAGLQRRSLAGSPRRERGRPLAMAPYFFPLDALGAWNRLYGPAGLIQYQFVLPTSQLSPLRRCFQLLRRLPVYLAVFKRFGPRYGGPLSFPIEGWTLAVDLPAAAPGLLQSLDALDEIVGKAAGACISARTSGSAATICGRCTPTSTHFARCASASTQPA